MKYPNAPNLWNKICFHQACTHPLRAEAQMGLLSISRTHVSPGFNSPAHPLLSLPLGLSRCLACSQSPNQIHFICNQLEPLALMEETRARSKNYKPATPDQPTMTRTRRRGEGGGWWAREQELQRGWKERRWSDEGQRSLPGEGHERAGCSEGRQQGG